MEEKLLLKKELREVCPTEFAWTTWRWALNLGNCCCKSSVAIPQASEWITHSFSKCSHSSMPSPSDGAASCALHLTLLPCSQPPHPPQVGILESPWQWSCHCCQENKTWICQFLSLQLDWADPQALDVSHRFIYGLLALSHTPSNHTPTWWADLVQGMVQWGLEWWVLLVSWYVLAFQGLW